MATYLDFESKIEKIQHEIVSAHAIANLEAVEKYQKELEKEIEKTFGSLSDYQKLQLARHPDRPYSLDYIKLLMDDAYEIHGDRAFRDDPAILCYIGWIGGQKTMLIGEQKGRGVKNKIKRNFGMPNPEGYRKALRAVRLAEKFDIPVLMLIDTPGAYPGLGAEERGQSEAIARNLFEFSATKVPMISIVIGEGGSGGALAIGVADKLAMLRYSVFAVISPEGCSAILWNDPSKVETATKALKITPSDLLEHKLVDDVLDEPLIGAHRDKVTTAEAIKTYFLESVKALRELSLDEMLDQRYKRLTAVGAYSEK
ncbi:acetyl-CoA carboxylase carboxyl transferase subunit alpha [Sulfurovum sp. NBC37-1]|uniref:Acetyl-coenzyme A carboxylase carboxyl transferase subunit alpha n=1 Tax=Sulfurovum sp. (strain NBC37-1) TaxID=387093 RepID=ACCA_SULNB|nr:acetyl-CoA carboxylase carboxyl transferase subunit alpha [Sulfurovum sp. NBC37-1]A6QC95.1 RecName: Full=Acetyl-coenzyme A carboxylase carboxyl transferase subunit alpha; Short=ACCase subunit alpha; Short=Acetyl-CoA carboxylase carboxyltransferase subunit alpha [Sulfurovum sp. NBC37-1]BAF73104.1 acetyl-CoA carboxylase, carboxyl transferase subunit alpha [Sulfurovum sp. NBC37-1]